MPKPLHADQDDADDLLELLHVERDLAHLRVRRRGGVLTIESGPNDDILQHARLRRVTQHKWTLEVTTHMGEWQATGLRESMQVLVQTLKQQFPWVLAPLE